jgi:hypothetical protein
MINRINNYGGRTIGGVRPGLQRGKPAPDTFGGLKPYMEPQRYDVVEPQALLQNAGALGRHPGKISPLSKSG